MRLHSKLILGTLNKILKFNEGTREALAKFSGKSFTINALGVAITGSIDDSGLVTPSETTDVEILVPSGILSGLINQDKLALFRQLTITGDKEFGQALLELLANLHFAGLYAGLNPLNALILNQFAQLFAICRSYILHLNHTLSFSCSDYLLNQKQLIVNKFALNRFADDVDELKAKVELCSKKIAFLKNAQSLKMRT